MTEDANRNEQAETNDQPQAPSEQPAAQQTPVQPSQPQGAANNLRPSKHPLGRRCLSRRLNYNNLRSLCRHNRRHSLRFSSNHQRSQGNRRIRKARKTSSRKINSKSQPFAKTGRSRSSPPPLILMMTPRL